MRNRGGFHRCFLRSHAHLPAPMCSISPLAPLRKWCFPGAEVGDAAMAIPLVAESTSLTWSAYFPRSWPGYALGSRSRS